MSCVPISSFHHSEEPIWVSRRCRLPGNGVLRCHASGVPVPGSGVGHSALLLLQGPHQTTGVGLWVGEGACACVCVCVLGRWVRVHVHVCVCVCVLGRWVGVRGFCC